MRSAAIALLVGVSIASCDGDREDASLAPRDERAVRALLATFETSEKDATCVIDVLTERIGSDDVAELPRSNESPVNREEREKVGTQLAMAMTECRANPERTDCFALFGSKAKARRAVDRAARVGFDSAYVRPGSDRHGPTPAATFTTGKTDAAARQIRDSFPRFIARIGGRLGHPGSGCLEKTFFD